MTKQQILDKLNDIRNRANDEHRKWPLGSKERKATMRLLIDIDTLIERVEKEQGDGV